MIKNKNKILIVVLLLSIFFLIGCKTSNNIENKSYNVNIDINDINEAFIPASEKGTSAVVGVSLYTKTNIIRSWHLESTGSGAIYKGKSFMKDGSTKEIVETKDSNDVDYYEYYVLTNAHVVNTTSTNKEIKVYLSSIDTLVDGSLLGLNAYEDLAVVKFTTSIYILPLSFSDEDVKVGEIVLAIGNPLGYEYASTVTMGIISSASRFIDVERDINGDGRNDWEGTVEVIQHDAAINSGSSGGALINIKGELVGINAMKVTDKEEKIEGIGFAIPINTVKNVLSDMEEGKTASVNLLNKTTAYSVNDLLNRDVLKLEDIPSVDLTDLNYTYGAYIYMSLGNEYGLRSGDVIIKMNEHDIYNERMLEAYLRSYKGNKIVWTAIRNGEEIEIEYLF